MMRRQTAVSVISVALIIAAAALSHAPWLRVSGIAPNLVLVTLIVIALLTDNVAWYGLLLLLAATLARFTPTLFDPVAVVTIVVAAAAFWFKRRMVWPGSIGITILAASGTVATYLLLSPSFIWQYPGVVFFELVYNVIIGIVLFEVMHFFFGRYIRE